MTIAGSFYGNAYKARVQRPQATIPYASAQAAKTLQPRNVRGSRSKEAIKAALSLKQHGWASIEGILNREECQEYEDGFWDWMEGLDTGVKREDPSTWSYPSWPPSFRGIINSLEVAHQAFVWKVRKHPRLTEMFAELWGSNALLSSFDSINALPATESPPAESWLHVDQAPHRRGAACIQGLVNLVDVGPDTTGTLLVKHGSHSAHQKFFEEVSQMSEEEKKSCIDHYQFTPEELDYWKPYRSIGVQGKAGSLFLWDSRAVHANVFPAATSGMRHVVYTCYQPASLANEQDLQQKQEAYGNYRLTTHWPAMNIRLYDDASAVEYYGAEADSNKPQYQVKRTRDKVEDCKLLQLAGMLPYSPEEADVRPALMDLSEGELRNML